MPISVTISDEYQQHFSLPFAFYSALYTFGMALKRFSINILLFRQYVNDEFTLILDCEYKTIELIHTIWNSFGLTT